MSSQDAEQSYAPGWPGIPPRWTSSAKSGVGTASSPFSRVWFTISHGILNEVYFPRVDIACIRDFGLIVTDGREFFSEEKRHASCELAYLAEGVPAYRLVNTCSEGRYRVAKEVLTDPRRNTLLQRVRFSPLRGELADYRLYTLLAPHLANCGAGNTAWVEEYKGVPMLMAARGAFALALACSAPWLKRSVGFVGSSDGWQDLSRHKRMTWIYTRAENGNVALTAEVDLAASNGEFVLALGFGQNGAEAGQTALASLREGFERARSDFILGWQDWHDSLLELHGAPGSERQYRISAMVLRTHEAKTVPGGLIASLSIPWGFAKGDEDLGGYHLVWPRDMVEAAGGLLAAGLRADALRLLRYLEVTQEGDGHWPQNMWLDGTSFWSSVQMDEAALPILLVDLALREGALEAGGLRRFWPMARRAAAYLVANGPVTQQDRWEHDPGYSPFTLAVEIAALLAAAEMADRGGEPDVAAYLRETADYWNSRIEPWVYVTGGDLASRVGVEGYYVRLAPPELAEAASPHYGFVPIKSRVPGASVSPDHVVSPDALALVRFGLRAADDPRIVNTVRVIDELLRVETQFGPVWRRYTGDDYGEHEDGSPFDGTGLGRVWPLLTGERAHYELAAGRPEKAAELLRTMEALAGQGGMMPEQTWDGPDLPERELFFGRPSGSAMPLAWAHAEHVKLRRSLRDGKVFDTPRQPVSRYIVEHTGSGHAVWRFNHKIRTMPPGKTLRLEVLAPAVVRWSRDEWKSFRDTPTRDTRLGVHLADLAVADLQAGGKVFFTFFWPKENRWENADFTVEVE